MSSMDEQPSHALGEKEPPKERARRVLLWSCLVSVVLLALILYGLYRFAIRLGLSGSISL